MRLPDFLDAPHPSPKLHGVNQHPTIPPLKRGGALESQSSSDHTPQLKDFLRAFVACNFLDFPRLLVAFFFAIVFLLVSDCPQGRSHPYKQILVQKSSRRRLRLIPHRMRKMPSSNLLAAPRSPQMTLKNQTSVDKFNAGNTSI